MTRPTWIEQHRLPVPDSTELTDPAADQRPVILQLAADAEAERELEAGN